MQAENTVDLLDIMFSDYSTSYRKARRSLRYGPKEFKKDWAEAYRRRQTFYSLLNQLKREGLVSKKKEGRRSFWTITKEGLRKLKKIKEDKDQTLSKKIYNCRESDALIIVSFDIPERERRKRSWLRASLVSLGFNKLQQSVWAGKVKLPEDFIKDLRDYRMLPYIHIFQVSKQGTTKKVSLSQ